jgi:transcriptional regulator with XRE-family HTH domain
MNATSQSQSIAGALIRQIRHDSGLTQAELARRAGVQSSVLSAYEHGSRQPSVAALVRIAEAAGMKVRVTAPPEDAATARAGRFLAQVLDLAEQLPYKPSHKLRYPPLYRIAA